MIKNKLKSWRHKHEMNQTEFAEYIGFDRRLYNRWEQHAKEPNIDSAWKIAKRLNCHIEDLFEELSE